MILLIDNYDSFTYNLYQYIGIFNSDIKVVRNDKITIDEITAMDPERIVLSPGPKNPKEAGICMDVVREFTGKKPILGICLGHQCIGEALGGTVSYAKALFHGKQSLIEHDGSSVFTGINSPILRQHFRHVTLLPGQIFFRRKSPPAGQYAVASASQNSVRRYSLHHPRQSL